MSSINQHLKHLTPVKSGDSVLEAASAQRMNAIMGALKALARGDNIERGPNILKRTGDGFVILRGVPGGGGRRGGAPFPFRVSVTTISGQNPAPALTVYPGEIEGITPTIYGSKLTADPIPKFIIGGGSFTLSLLVNVSLNVDDNYRYAITDNNVMVQDAGNPTPTWKMHWTDEAIKDTGYFYINLANIAVTPSQTDGPPTVAVTQLVFSSFRNLVFIRDQVVAIGTDTNPVPV